MPDQSKQLDSARSPALPEPCAAALHRRLLRAWWFVAVPLLTLVVLFLGWFYWVSAPPRKTAAEFERALADADYQRAFALCSPALQQQLGDARRLQQVAQASGPFYQPLFWDQCSAQGDRLTLRSTAEVNGHGYSASIVLEKAGLDWRVARFSSAGSGLAPLHLPPP